MKTLAILQIDEKGRKMQAGAVREGTPVKNGEACGAASGGNNQAALARKNTHIRSKFRDYQERVCRRGLTWVTAISRASGRFSAQARNRNRRFTASAAKITRDYFERDVQHYARYPGMTGAPRGLYSRTQCKRDNRRAYLCGGRLLLVKDFVPAKSISPGTVHPRAGLVFMRIMGGDGINGKR